MSPHIARLDPKQGFYLLGIPFLLALNMGWHSAHNPQWMAKLGMLAYYLGLSLLIWGALYFATRAVSLLLGRLFPVWLVLVIGGLLSIPLATIPVRLYLIEFGGRHMSGSLLSLPALMDMVPGLAAWLVVNLFFERCLGGCPFPVRRAQRQLPGIKASIEDRAAVVGSERGSSEQNTVPGVSTETRPDLADESTGIWSRLQRFPLSRIVILEACDHYVKIYSCEGDSELVHGRFKDAAATVSMVSGVSGLQIHRSYWVAFTEMQRVVRRGNGYRLELLNGYELPVSRQCIAELRKQLEQSRP